MIKRIDALIGLGMLVFAIGFNLWLYRLEPTAKVDPNDNAFQFALVDRTNTMWDFASKKCSGNLLTFPICHFTYLADHWVPNWAEGYNLPYYYSHIPQILTVASWRAITLVARTMSLFQYYHWLIYLLLCFFPLSVFIALKVMKLPWWVAGIGALLACQVSTDGLYGLDPSSFLWRGYGLSSQLYAMIWFPLALAYSWRYINLSTKLQTQNPKKIQSTKEQKLTKFQFNFLNFNIILDFDIWNLDFLFAVFFLVATTAGHLGIGMISLLSLIPLAFAEPIMLLLHQQPLDAISQSFIKNFIRLALLGTATIFFLSYWIIPTLVYDKFHNISFWDPVWKFNSYGWKETMTRLFNGDLFDFGRAQIYTGLVLLGSFVTLLPGFKNDELRFKNVEENKKTLLPLKSLPDRQAGYLLSPLEGLYPFAFLFMFWLLMYYGRTTWGGLIDLIPGMKDFHLSRFIVGVHATGMLLAPVGFYWLVIQLQRIIAQISSRVINVSKSKQKTLGAVFTFIAITIAGIIILPPIYNRTIEYNTLNDTLIIQANGNATKEEPDEKALFAKIRSLLAGKRDANGDGGSGRVFAGRGGSWGKTFRIAETPYFMQLSTYGVPTVLWLPETWSMNSDTEQYFSEDQAKDYDLYNIRYVAAPLDQEAKPFWKLIAQSDTWKLYQVPTTGYFTVGTHAAIVASDKQSFGNVIRLWIQSDYSKQGIFPELTFDKGFPRDWGLPNFRMVDEANYMIPKGSVHNLFNEPPKYMADPPKMKLLGPETNDTDMVFSTKVQADDGCSACLLILKQSYAPGWRATVDGQSVTPINVFPFFIGIPITGGTHTVVVWYQPGTLKVFLLVITILVSIGAVVLYFRRRKKS